MYNSNPTEWANLIFSNADLGDPRRTKRLAQLASDMASKSSESIVKASGSPANIEAAYRFIRNENICPEAIAESGFQHTSDLSRQRPLILAIQDTTGLTFKHNVTDELGDVSCCNKANNQSRTRTLYAHSTLMLDAKTEQTLGLAHQKYWFRDKKVQGSREEQQKRSYKEKESYRWKQCFDEVKARTGDISNIIDVCDREADMYEYLDYHTTHHHRFLVRAKENRKLVTAPYNLAQLLETVQGECCYTVNVNQRGGRKARQARMTLSYQSITISKPKRAEGHENIEVNVIVCQEKDGEHNEPLCWVLYTNEAINTAEDAQRIVRYYELRWRIEEFHKTWKSDGTEVESLRLQRLDNIKRIAVIQAFIAVRLLQLQEMIQNKESAKQVSCEVYVEDTTWRILWMKVEKGHALPASSPSLHWLYYAIAKLGGWYDSKRNGRVGVAVLWCGWLKLAEIVESVQMLNTIKQTGKL